MPVTCSFPCWTSLYCLAGVDTSSSFMGIQPSLFVGWAACCGPPTVPSLELLSPSGSLIRCEPVHLCSWVPLYHLSGFSHEDWSLDDFPLCNLGNRATLCCPLGIPQSLAGSLTEFSFSHWPASGVGGHNLGCHIVAFCWGGGTPDSRSQCRQSSLPNIRLARVKPIVSWVNALLARRNTGDLAPQSFWCNATILHKWSSAILV
jgi:hypothetical protein